MTHRTLLSGILFFCSILTATTAFALPTFQYFVEDSTQPTAQSVGCVISVSTELALSTLTDLDPSNDTSRHVMALIPIAKVPQPVTAADWWKPGVRIHPDEIPYRGALFFTDPNCSTTPWIGEFQINGEFDPAFDPHVVIGNNLDPNIRTLYGADPAAPISVAMVFTSFISGNAGCNPIARNIQAKPAILLDADLHSTYPPPYKLQFNVIL